MKAKRPPAKSDESVVARRRAIRETREEQAMLQRLDRHWSDATASRWNGPKVCPRSGLTGE